MNRNVVGMSVRSGARAFTAVVLLLAACEGLLPGPDDFEPSGTDFNLNPNIELLLITGKNTGFPPTGTFPFSFAVRSRNSGIECDTLPAGLLFRSKKSRVQHVLMLKPHIISTGPSPVQFELGMFCCNEFREMPRASDTFELGPITDNAGLREIVDRVRDRDISGHLWMVQRAVWMVTDSTGLNQAYRDSLDNLPPARI
ncbi:MAG: hypothetical protein ABIL25_06325 [candidate division WOR-3 bacterium]